MSNQLYYDQISVISDIGFNENEIFGSQTISSFVKGIFGSGSEKWKHAFPTAFSFSGKSAAFIVGETIYRLSCDNGQIIHRTNQNISNPKDTAIAFTLNSEILNLYVNGIVYEYDEKLSILQEHKLKIKCQKLIPTKLGLLALAGNTLSRVESGKVVLSKIPEWSISLYTQDQIILIGKAITSIEKDLSLTSFQNLINAPRHATLSPSGKMLAIIDDINVKVFDPQNGFDLLYTYSPPGISQVMVWSDSHLVFVSDAGLSDNLSFVTLKGSPVQQRQIPIDSILRQTADGFILFEQRQLVGSTRHYEIKLYKSVTPEELYERSCAKGQFGTALVLLHNNNLDPDIYEKAYVQQNSLSQDVIFDHLLKIKDTDFILNFCRTSVTTNRSLAGMLITAGLKISSDDEVLKRHQERLQLHQLISRDSYIIGDWVYFRDCDLEEQLTTWANEKEFRKIRVVLDCHKFDDEKVRWRVNSAIYPMIPPDEYRDLLPRDEEWFDQRAEQIEDVTGQTDLIVKLFKIGSEMLPSLKTKYQFAIEFDSYINKIADIDSAIGYTFQRYAKLSDKEKLILFIGRETSGSKVVSLLSNEARTIAERSPDSLFGILKDSVSSNKSLFTSLTPAKKIDEMAIILANAPTEWTDKLVEMLDAKLNMIVAQSLQHWTNLSTRYMGLVTLAIFLTKTMTGMTFAELKAKATDTFILEFLQKVVHKHLVNIDQWEQLYKACCMLGLGNQIESLNLIQLILLQPLDQFSIEVDSQEKADITIQTAEELLRVAPSCSSENSDIKRAISALNWVPHSYMPEKKHSAIMRKVRVYQTFDKLGSNLTPAEIESGNIVDLVVDLIMKKTPPYDLDQFYKEVNQIEEHSPLIQQAIATIALRDGKTNEGIKYLEGLDDDSLKIAYLRSTDWTDTQAKLAICTQAIPVCNKEYLKEYLSIRLECENDLHHDLFITDYSQVFQNCLKKNWFRRSFISNPYSRNALIEYATKLEAADFRKLVGLVSKAMKGFRPNFDEIIKQGDFVTGFACENHDVEYCNAMTIAFVRARWNEKIEHWEDAATKFFELGIQTEEMMNLVDFWKLCGRMTPEFSSDICLKVPQLAEDGSWKTLLGEDGQLKVLEHTKNYRYGLASEYQKVQEAAIELMKSAKLDENDYATIIEKGITWKFVGTRQMNRITEYARHKPHFQMIFKSLEENNQIEALAIFIAKFFDIPKPMVVPCRYHDIIEHGRKFTA